jgi:cell division septum initiation protein DivIVA
LAEISKNDILISDLSAIETQLSILINKNKDLSTKNIELEETLNSLKKENSVLLQKLAALENEVKNLDENTEANLFNSLNLKERENLKVRLQNLITRIDYHLSS